MEAWGTTTNPHMKNNGHNNLDSHRLKYYLYTGSDFMSSFDNQYVLKT